MFKNSLKSGIAVAATCLLSLSVTGQEQTPSPSEHSLWSNGVFIVMLCVICMLLFIIIGLAEMVKGAGNYQAKKKKSNGNKFIATTLLFIAGVHLYAQQANADAGAVIAEPFNYWRMGAMTFYAMLIVIVFELLIVYMLFRTGMSLLDIKEKRIRSKAENPDAPTFIEKLNASVAIEHEEAILFDHDYDGIRELDNDLPPWWKYGFYLTVVVAIIYMAHFHIFHTGKSSLQEYEQQVKEGNEQVAEYKKKAVNLVSEENVTFLSDAGSISAGKNIFMANCTACHGELGEGKDGLGPNFCDDYWLHGGSIKDIFKSVKYGWTDKGMKSWEQDLKPSEIQLVASFIKSLRGTNPPHAKEKQGELYIEEGAAPNNDSVPHKTDTIRPVTNSVK